ncbi:unnamed protein product [Callosobruchus maculatus]|uniref:Uncharacterized protein n=1 Tax=Callosobruchus maculatus TaxID=64391 RepID=A0A653C0V7_CALMS|nr:unnamed protein product [Callosobruchus maculatus]
MQSEILAVEDAMKIEVDAVKTEPVEAEGELIGIEQTRRPKVKHGNTDESVLTRIKKEQVVNDWKNELEMQDSKVKLEGDVNYEEFKFEAEEVIIKDENDDLKEANGEIAVNSSRIKKEQVDNDWDWENELKMQDTKNELKMQDTKVKLEEDVNCEELKIEAEEVIIKEENDDFKDANGGIAVKR